MLKPILFNTKMVQAVQVGRKTQTRRIIRPQPEALPEHLLEAGMNIIHKGKLCKLHVPYGYAARTRGELIVKPVKPPCRPGDILWVRETWTPFCFRKDTANNNAVLGHADFCYKASPDCMDEMGLGCKWHPSIHMPKEAARIFLRVKDVRVERLQSGFSKDGAAIMELQKEGVEIGETCTECIAQYGHPCCIDPDGNTECGELDNPRYEFSRLWDSTIKPANLDKYGWNANPWVWVIEFERCEKPEGWCV